MPTETTEARAARGLGGVEASPLVSVAEDTRFELVRA